MEDKAVREGISDEGLTDGDKSGVRPLPPEQSTLADVSQSDVGAAQAISVAAEELGAPAEPSGAEDEAVDVSEIAILEEPVRRTVPPPLPQRTERKSVDDGIDFGDLLAQATRSRATNGTEFFAPVASVPAVAPDILLHSPRRGETRLSGQLARFAVIGSTMLAGALVGTLQPSWAAQPEEPAAALPRAVSVSMSAATPEPAQITVLEPIVVDITPPVTETASEADSTATEPEPEVASSIAPTRRQASEQSRVSAPAPLTPAGTPTAQAAAHPAADSVSELLERAAPEPQPVPVAVTTPTREQVIAAMGVIRNQVLRCANGQHGRTVVHVSVGATGQVRQALVTGPLAGTPAGSCVARVVRTARFPAFSQPSFSFDFPYAY